MLLDSMSLYSISAQNQKGGVKKEIDHKGNDNNNSCIATVSEGRLEG